MRYLLSFFLLTCFGETFSQSRFSITPTFENSFQNSKYLIDKEYISNGYYVFRKQVFTKPFQFSPLEIGILINYQLRNNWKISVGVAQTSAQVGYSTHFKYMDTGFWNGGDTLIYDSYFKSDGGVAMTKFPIWLSKTFFTNDSIQLFYRKPVIGIKMDFFLGVNFMTKPRGTSPLGNDVLAGTGADSLLIYPKHYLSYQERLVAIRGHGLSYSAGMKFILKNNKQKEIFSFAAYYTYSRRTHVKQIIDITVDNNKFAYVIYGTGSGIYVQLSRSFNIPARKAKKEIK